MIPVLDAFSTRYAEARVKFLEAASAGGLAITSHVHPLPGRDGETLAMDVALDGPANADKLLIVSSACHGVEGYCGSGVQVFALHDDEWRAAARAAGVSVLYIHALNPYGFSHIRRVTHENVDLNRNFQDFEQPLVVNEAYRDVHLLLVPDEWPPTAANQAAIEGLIAKNGMAWFQRAVTGGQHEFPQGLFYGGTAPTWSNVTLRQVLRTHAQSAKKLGWIDLHTGLGPSGHGERICATRNNAADIARARAWWGNEVTNIYDGSSASAELTGLMWHSAYQECPQAEYTGIAMEYGTVPVMDVVNALRAEQWLTLHPDAPADQAAAIKQQMLDAFYTQTDLWKGQIVSQARQAMFQAVQGLNQG